MRRLFCLEEGERRLHSLTASAKKEGAQKRSGGFHQRSLLSVEVLVAGLVIISVDCANISTCGPSQFTNTKFTRPDTQISKSHRGQKKAANKKKIRVVAHSVIAVAFATAPSPTNMMSQVIMPKSKVREFGSGSLIFF